MVFDEEDELDDEDEIERERTTRHIKLESMGEDSHKFELNLEAISDQNYINFH